MADWESIFKVKGKVFLKPQEDMPRVIKFLKKEKAKRILDLGCGTGRHTFMLAKAGFEVYGTDISKEGIKQTKEWLKEKGLQAKLKVSSCYRRFPFKEGFFNAIISVLVIHHNHANKIRFCISEIERVLKPNGIVFVIVPGSIKSLTKRLNCEVGSEKFKKIGPRNFVPLDGDEEGILHYVYTKALMLKDFRNFKVIDFHKDSGDHYCLLGRLKKNSTKYF